MLKKNKLIVFVVVLILLITIFFIFKGISSGDSCGSECDWDYMNQAQETNSIKLCLKIDDEGLKNNCKDSVNYNLAFKDGEISFCNEINENLMKERCKNGIVFEKIINQETPDLCDELKNSIICKDFFFYIKSSEDEQLCNEISNQPLQNLCSLGEPISIETMQAMGLPGSVITNYFNPVFEKTEEGRYIIKTGV